MILIFFLFNVLELKIILRLMECKRERKREGGERERRRRERKKKERGREERERRNDDQRIMKHHPGRL